MKVICTNCVSEDIRQEQTICQTSVWNNSAEKRAYQITITARDEGPGVEQFKAGNVPLTFDDLMLLMKHIRELTKEEGAQ
jgi:hypothetical protein